MVVHQPYVSCWHECRLMFNLAGPSALVNAMRIAQLLTDQAVLGHLKYQGKGTACYLDAASLAILWMTLTLTVMTRGVSGTINMLCSQALGAGNRKLSDTWLVTGLILSVAAAAIISALWLLTEDVVSLYAANQTLGSASDHAGSCADGPGDPVKLAASYAIHSTAYTLPTLWTECVNAWLLAERIIRPQLCVYALALVGNLALNIVLVHGIGGWHGLGFLGSPLATTATRASCSSSCSCACCPSQRSSCRGCAFARRSSRRGCGPSSCRRCRGVCRPRSRRSHCRRAERSPVASARSRPTRTTPCS